MYRQSPFRRRPRELWVSSNFRAYTPGDLTGGVRLHVHGETQPGSSKKAMHLPGVDICLDDTLGVRSFTAGLVCHSSNRACRHFPWLQTSILSDCSAATLLLREVITGACRTPDRRGELCMAESAVLLTHRVRESLPCCACDRDVRAHLPGKCMARQAPVRGGSECLHRSKRTTSIRSIMPITAGARG
jgi:hypothetical protein